MCDAVQVVQLRFWRTGHVRMASTLATAVDGESEIQGSWIRNHAQPHEDMRWLTDAPDIVLEITI